jgi:hypothetical protein
MAPERRSAGQAAFVEDPELPEELELLDEPLLEELSLDGTDDFSEPPPSDFFSDDAEAPIFSPDFSALSDFSAAGAMAPEPLPARLSFR